MHALLLDRRQDRLDRLQIAFLEAGIHVTGSGSLQVAECCLRRAMVDVVLVDEVAANGYLKEIIGMAERRNPKVVTLMLSDHPDALADQWSDRLTSLFGVMEHDTDAAQLARMAKAALASRASQAAPAQPAAAVAPQPQPAVAAKQLGAPPAVAQAPATRPTISAQKSEAPARVAAPSVPTDKAPVKRGAQVLRAKAEQGAQVASKPAAAPTLRAETPNPAAAGNNYPALKVHPALAAQRKADAARAAEAEQLAIADRQALAQARVQAELRARAEAERRAQMQAERQAQAELAQKAQVRAAAEEARLEKARSIARERALAHAAQVREASKPVEPAPAPKMYHAKMPPRPTAQPDPMPRPQVVAEAPIAAPQDDGQPIFQSSRRRLGLGTDERLSA